MKRSSRRSYEAAIARGTDKLCLKPSQASSKSIFQRLPGPEIVSPSSSPRYTTRMECKYAWTLSDEMSAMRGTPKNSVFRHLVSFRMRVRLPTRGNLHAQLCTESPYVFFHDHAVLIR
jgi:hypothetical protein